MAWKKQQDVNNQSQKVEDDSSTCPIPQNLSTQGIIIEKWITEYTILPDGRKFGKTYCIDKQVKQFNKDKAKKPKQKGQQTIIIKEAEEFD